MKTIIKTVSIITIIGNAAAQTAVSLIDEDFVSETISNNARIRTNQDNGNFWQNADSQWEIIGETLSSPGTTSGPPTEGAIYQVVNTSDLATDLTNLTLSFDYTAGATSTLRFALVGYTQNLQTTDPVQLASNTILMNNGTSNGALQNNTQGELRHGDMNLLTGADMTQSITNDLTFAPGTSGSHSVTIDLTSYAWNADEAAGADPTNTPGLSGSIASIADFDQVVLVAINDLTDTVGATPTTLDNIQLTASAVSSSAVPNIISIELDEDGNVVLTLDGPETGLTVQQSDDLSIALFADVASTSGANTLTIASADVDPNADGADFYRIRN